MIPFFLSKKLSKEKFIFFFLHKIMQF